MKFLGWMFLILLMASEVLAGVLTSTNYKLDSGRFTGGSELELTSAGLALQDGTLEGFSKEAMAGTNYRMEGDVSLAVDPLFVPVIQSVTPADRSRFYLDQNTSFQVTAREPEGESLQYQLEQEQAVRAAYQSSSTIGYGLRVSDEGRHVLSFKVKDPDGTVVLPQDSYFLRRPLK